LIDLFCLIDPTSLDGRNLPDYPSFIFDVFEMVIDTFEMQRQYLTSSMTIFNLIIQLIANKGKQKKTNLIKNKKMNFFFSRKSNIN